MPTNADLDQQFTDLETKLSPDTAATFRQRFAANPQGEFAVMRPSTNIEDDRNGSFIRKMEDNLLNTYNKSVLKGVVDKATGAGDTFDDRFTTPAPDTTNDPLAQQLGYNSIPKVQKVIYPSWWK